MEQLFTLISPQLSNALGWTIIHSLWQASLIALLMSTIHKVYAHQTASFKYNVSVTALISVLFTSIITFSIYFFNSPREVFPASELSLLPENALILTESQTTLSNLQSFFTANLPKINLIWACGVILFLARFLFSYGYVKYLRLTSLKPLTGKLETILNKLIIKHHFPLSVNIAESTKIRVPLVIGHFKPLILFPLGVVNMLNTDEVEAVIMHELAHIKRHDYLLNLLLSLVEILFYFHPAIWWISANIKSERENCCDDLALGQGINTITYTQALVKLEEIKSAGIPALAMPFSSRKGQLLNRIKRIMNMPQTKNEMKEKSIATVLLFSIVLLFSARANSKTTDPHLDSAPDIAIAQDSSRITAINQMVLKVSKGKFESLTIDDQVLNASEVADIAETINLGAKDNDEYQVTIKGNPRLYLSNGQAHFEGQGGVIYEDLASSPISVIGNTIEYDTIPEKRNHSSMTIHTNDNGKVIELKKENGNVTSLKIDGKEIPKKDYPKYDDIITGKGDSGSNIFNFDNDFEEEFDTKDFSKSFGMLFDGENWREFGGNMGQFMDEETLEKLRNMKGMRFDFDFDDLKNMNKWKGFENLQELNSFERMEKLGPLLEEMGIRLDSTLKSFDFKFEDFDNLNGFQHFDDNGDVRYFDGNGFNFEGQTRSTVVDKIGNTLNKDGLLQEYKTNKVELSGKHLKINGEKMPKALFEKYKKIYQESTGAPLTKDSKMIFSIEGKPSKRKVKTF